jgi:hypothetical protein
VPCNGAKTNKNSLVRCTTRGSRLIINTIINNNQLFELDKKYECLGGSYHGFNIITDNHNENRDEKNAFLKCLTVIFLLRTIKQILLKAWRYAGGRS